MRFTRVKYGDERCESLVRHAAVGVESEMAHQRKQSQQSIRNSKCIWIDLTTTAASRTPPWLA
jgi:hypothetical protein